MPRLNVASLGRLVPTLALLFLLLPARADAIDVAVYGAPASPSWNTEVVNKLVATGQFDSVTGVLVKSGYPVPTLADTQAYDAVLVYSDSSFNNSTSIGNLLADYMDSGGGVVMATFAFYNSSAGLGMNGRVVSDGYLPFTQGTQSQGSPLTMSEIAPGHPILDGVSSLNGGSSSYHNNPISFVSGVTQVANWSNGRPLIAEWSPPSTSGSIVGLNFYPPSSDSRGDFWTSSTDGDTILANSLTFVAGGQPPVADAGGPYTINEGSTPVLDGSGTTDPDGDITTYEWDCTDDGVYDVSVATPTATGCTYGDQQTHTLRLKVTDAAGNVSEATALVIVANVAPFVTGITIPTAFEAVSITMSATATDIPEDTISYEWDFGDGSPAATGASVSHTYDDDGAYTVSVIVSDEDGGVSPASLGTATVQNVAPTIDSFVLEDGDEGSPINVSGSGSDIPADTVTITWDFGDGSPTVTGSPASHTYDDDGSYTVTMTASDEDGGSTDIFGTVDIGNVAPSLVSITNPGFGPEGTFLAFAATGTDVSAADAASLTFTWSWGDGEPDSTGETPTHSFGDGDDTFTITVTVDDGDGGTASDTTTISIENVDPTITSTPGGYALEGNVYTHTPIVVDPGDEVFTWAVAGPAALTADPSTGVISWIPTYEDAIGGPVEVTLFVDDGDGGSDEITWSILVSTIDNDADGMADGWELDNGLDPTDPTDALEDPDEDGIINVDEFTGGTDPFEYDGPSIPEPVTPLTDEEVATLLPDLLFTNSTDPQEDVLTYTIEVYEDEALTLLLTSITDYAEDPSGETAWTVDVPLVENAWYWWRASAWDGTVESDFCEAQGFFTNEIEEAPGVPTPLFPVGGEVLALALGSAFTECSTVTDPEADAITYEIRIWDDALTTIIGEGTVTEVPEEDSSAFWIIDSPLVENTAYAWDVRAVDEHGTASDYSEAADFYFSTENEPPSGIEFLEPEDNSAVVGLSPTLVASEGVDPEGTPIQYRFEMDTVNTFDGADFVTRSIAETLTGTVELDLSEGSEPVELPNDAWVFARVRGTDADGISSPWDVITFFSRGENDPPDVPLLLDPEDNATWESEEAPTLTIGNVTDPEGDDVSYDYAVWADAEGTLELAAVLGIAPDPSGQTTIDWPEEVPLEGDVYWTARSTDDLDARSEWAFPNLLRFDIQTGPITGDDDDSADTGDDDDGGGGCDCDSSLVSEAAPTSALLLLLAPVAALLRRRR